MGKSCQYNALDMPIEYGYFCYNTFMFSPGNIPRILRILAYIGMLSPIFTIPILVFTLISPHSEIPDSADLLVTLSVAIIPFISMISIILGYVLIGKKLNKPFVWISGIIAFFFECVTFNLSMYIYSYQPHPADLMLIAVIYVIAQALTTILLGVSLIKLQADFGRLSIAAGILFLLAGLLGLPIINRLILQPAIILCIIIFFRAAEKFSLSIKETV